MVLLFNYFSMSHSLDFLETIVDHILFLQLENDLYMAQYIRPVLFFVFPLKGGLSLNDQCMCIDSV